MRFVTREITPIRRTLVTGCHAPDFTADDQPKPRGAEHPNGLCDVPHDRAWLGTCDVPDSQQLLCVERGARGQSQTTVRLATTAITTIRQILVMVVTRLRLQRLRSNPNHALRHNSPQIVPLCHSETAWAFRLRYDHNVKLYPFTGAHIAIANDCALCHIGGNFNQYAEHL
jgi:hypothetical protein